MKLNNICELSSYLFTLLLCSSTYVNGQFFNLANFKLPFQEAVQKSLGQVNPSDPIQSGVEGLSKELQVPSLKNFNLFDENFGLKKGPGCFPLFGEVVRLLWSDCQTKADSLTWNTWGDQIKNALKGGQIDLLKAGQETCKLQADKQSCRVLAARMQNCDILGTIQTTVELQNAKRRCEQLANVVDFIPASFLQQNNPQNNLNNLLGGRFGNQLFGNIGNLIGGEVAGGFLRHFLG